MYLFLKGALDNFNIIPTFFSKKIEISISSEAYSTNENPSLSRSNFLANLMHGHSDSSWSGSSLPEITEQRIFHVLFYYEQIRLKCIINCIYPSWLNFYEYYFGIFVAKAYIVYKNMNFIHLLLSQFFYSHFSFQNFKFTSKLSKFSQLKQECYYDF